MSVDELSELPERGCYEEGRDKRMRPEELEKGDECLLRFQNRSTGDVFEMAVKVREPADAEDSECDRLYVDIHCTRTFDREVEFKFDKEDGCIIQICGGEQQEIGYVVRTIKNPDEALATFAREADPVEVGENEPAQTA